LSRERGFLSFDSPISPCIRNILRAKRQPLGA
jgi:hypothetical protein